MTENKRFTIGMLKTFVNDNEKNYCYSLGIPTEANHLCDLLNELNEKNHNLRESRRELITANNEYRKEINELRDEIKRLNELVSEVDNGLEIRDIVCGAGKFRLEEWGKHRYHQFYKGDEELEDESVVIMLMELEKENKELKKENEQLKESVYSWSKSYSRVCEENKQLQHKLLCKQLDKAPTEPINCKCNYEVKRNDRKRFRISKVFELNKPFPIYDGDCPLTQKEASDLLNELHDENKELKEAYTKLKHKHSNLHDMCIDIECERDSLKKDVDFLEEQNKKLKIENELLSDELEQCKAIINKKWSECLKKKELSE